MNAEGSEDATETVLRHTEIGAAPLVPEIRVHLLRDDSPLWKAFGEGPEADTVPRPYWAFAWSGGQAIARYLLDHNEVVAGRRVFDFGAGCGIGAIAAMMAGAAAAEASDIDPMATAAVKVNAGLHRVDVTTVCEDLIYSPGDRWDVVLAGDIWYDSRLARHGLRWLRTLADEGITVLVADPGRHYSPSGNLTELARYEARSVPDLEHPNVREAIVYRLPGGLN